MHGFGVGIRRTTNVLVFAAAVACVEAWSAPALRHSCLSRIAASAANAEPAARHRPSVLVIGGTGKIGSAVASHLLFATSSTEETGLHVVLAGRSASKGRAAIEELEKAAGGAEALAARGQFLSFQQLDYTDSNALERLLTESGDSEGMSGFDACVHTAGPFFDGPSVLRSCIKAKTKVYVDVADPVPYLTEALESSAAAEDAGTLALVAAGAFPGLSNLLGMEAASQLEESDSVRDLEFNYFTAGLGGSGDVNLYITNVGFGEPVYEFKDGRERQRLIAGKESRPVDFGDEVGLVNCWAWPFPEGLTVGRQLQIKGDSRVAMGTAPEIWNVIMGAMVSVVPRQWWLSPAFSQGLASFSQPMVKLTDSFVGETHAIRVDVCGDSGRRIRALQTHESFRVCVGQSCAEFTLALLAMQRTVDSLPGFQHAGRLAGVYLPEQLFQDPGRRAGMLSRLTATPGTMTYSVCELDETS